MPTSSLSLQKMRQNARKFINKHIDDSNERSESQIFWRDFFEIFGIDIKDVVVFEEAVTKFNNQSGFIDAFWKGKLLIEHKSRGKNLDSAYEQAIGYLDTLSSKEKPRYIIVSDFERIRVKDLYTKSVEEIHLEDLDNNIQLFRFIYETDTIKHTEQKELNSKAALIMAELHDALKNTNYSIHDLELFMIRLLFCLYAEDTGIFKKDQFYNYVKNIKNNEHVGERIQFLFRILDQPMDKRQINLPEELTDFPYVNGKLFEKIITPPIFTEEIYNQLLNACLFDWSTISPAIFGSLFQYVMDPEARRYLGAHYTSEANILKVVNSLFMNKLWDEFENAGNNIKKLNILWNKMGDYKFLDPACGCGNFLIIAYRELRLLEIRIIRKILKIDDGDTKQVLFSAGDISKINISNFYGIEIEEFPSRVAQVAMWFIEHQMNLELETLDIHHDNLPLNNSVNILIGDALKLNWEDFLPANNNVYLLGNPPFVGARLQKTWQKESLKEIFNNFKNVGNLDYVCGWYKKACEYIQGTDIEVSFVSTNSIVQGNQVDTLWKPLKERYGIYFNFAHQTFRWSNEAKRNASVYCIIIGFSQKERDKKILFTYENVNDEVPQHNIVDNINSYLINFKEVFVKSRKKPLCEVPEMCFGSMPNDGGNLLLSVDEKNKLLDVEPEASKFVKPLVSSREYLHNKEKYCLWLTDIKPSELNNLKYVKERVEKVKEHRLNSSRKATRELAEYPTLFGYIKQPKNDYIIMPLTTSENRDYIPISFKSKNTIVNNTVSTIETSDLFIFGVLTSHMHMVWVKYVCGRLKGDYRYSSSIVYNNFPFPQNVSNKIKKDIEINVREILDIRDKFKDESLADLYNPLTMPPQLKKAHKKLDVLVEKAYVNKKFKNDNERIIHLFKLYDVLINV